MKKLFLLFFLFFLNVISNGQDLDWVMSVAGMPAATSSTATPSGKTSALDAFGNLYYTAGGILRKYNTFGTLLWGVNTGKNGYAVAADKFGFIYITGETNNDVFIEKRDSAGNYIWTKIIEGGSADIATDINVDGNASIYVTGYFTDSIDFDPGVGTHFEDTGGAFIAKLDSAGNFLWVYTSLESMSNTSYYNAVAVDYMGNVYGAGVGGHTGSWGGFVDKVDSDGDFIWRRYYNGSTPLLGGDVLGIVVDSYYVYTTGLIDYDEGFTGKSFIQKSDAAGNEIWMKKFVGGMWCWEGGVAVDADGNVYAAGSCMPGSGDDFDPGPGYAMFTSWGVPTMFIIKLTSNGIYEWAHVPYMPTQSLNITSHGCNIAVDDQCNVYVTGAVTGGASIDVDPGIGETFISGNNLFLAKMTCTATGINTVSSNNALLEIYPNPSTGVINISSSSIIRNVQITDVLGRVVYTALVDSYVCMADISTASGWYYVTLITDDGMATQKIVIEK